MQLLVKVFMSLLRSFQQLGQSLVNQRAAQIPIQVASPAVPIKPTSVMQMIQPALPSVLEECPGS